RHAYEPPEVPGIFVSNGGESRNNRGAELMVPGVGVEPTRRLPFEGFYVPCVYQFRHPGWTVRGKTRSPCHRFQLTCRQRGLEREIQKIQDLTDNPNRQQVLIPSDKI